MNNKLKYESADDFALRIQLDYPEYVYLDEIEFDYFMPVSDDFMYYVPTNYKDWYTDSLNNFLKPLINDSKDRDGNIPLFIQFYIVFNITTKFLANMNNRNKRNMNDEELAVFFETARECFKFANDGFVLNKDKYVSLGYSEEAAEMFYMIKHNCVFKDMPFEYSEGKKRGLPQLQQCLYF